MKTSATVLSIIDKKVTIKIDHETLWAVVDDQQLIDTYMDPNIESFDSEIKLIERVLSENSRDFESVEVDNSQGYEEVVVIGYEETETDEERDERLRDQEIDRRIDIHREHELNN